MKPTLLDGATPIDPAWERDLLISVATMGELNELEQQNIVAALAWAENSTRLDSRLISVDGLRLLHRRMFEQVWWWAGTFHSRNLNLGIEWGYITTQVQNLCDDVAYWIERGTYGWIETAVRFHHRLVSIHPFFNGNGRHARIAANLLLRYHGRPDLLWGRANLATNGAVRDAYIAALKRADQEDIEPLVAFAQSGE